MYSTTPRENDNALTWALWYASLGWKVFPVHSIVDGVCTCGDANCHAPGKHPRTKRGHHAATDDAATIKRWWRTHPDANVGVATGSASGFMVIDVDPRNGGIETFRELEAALGQFPPVPYATTGGGGWHYLFLDPAGGLKAKAGPGVDVKGSGGYIVVPPSLHASGKRYAWAVTPDVGLNELPDAWRTHLARVGCYTDKDTDRNADSPRTSSDNTHDDTQGHHSRPNRLRGPGPAKEENGEIKEFIEAAIEATLPEARGQRHGALFAFARRLKAHAQLAEIEVVKLRPWVNRWYARAYEKLAGQVQADPMENWHDFAEGWDKIKFAGEAGVIEDALAKARERGIPAWAMDYPLEGARELVALCRELQRQARDKPFFLAVRTVQTTFGLANPMKASRWLDTLVRDGVLLRVERGQLAGRKASSFRYLKPLDE